MTARRSFLARLGAAAAALGLGAPSAQAQESAARPASGDARWQPARESKDDWLELPGKHRLIFDAISPEGVSSVQGYIRNYFDGHKTGYGLEGTEVAVVLVLRHRATQFAFTDAIWAKYGAPLSESDKFTDPKTGQAPTVNAYKAALETQVKRGVHFAACNMSTLRLSRFIAQKLDREADAIYKELTANALPNVHFVPAGIIAVNHAQERGYSVAYVG